MLLSANFSFQVEDDEKPSSELLDHLQVIWFKPRASGPYLKLAEQYMLEVGDNSSYNNFADHFRMITPV